MAAPGRKRARPPSGHPDPAMACAASWGCATTALSSAISVATAGLAGNRRSSAAPSSRRTSRRTSVRPAVPPAARSTSLRTATASAEFAAVRVSAASVAARSRCLRSRQLFVAIRPAAAFAPGCCSPWPPTATSARTRCLDAMVAPARRSLSICRPAPTRRPATAPSGAGIRLPAAADRKPAGCTARA